MGAVYQAEHRLMDRPVALKVINRSLTDNPKAIERFHREVKAAAKLLHPNIVTAYDAEQAGETHFLVMEFVPGVNLGQLVAEQGRLPVVKACDYARQVALGLQHAFENGMVHRDIKPQNLMITPSGQVKILDFGLARMVSEVSQNSALTGTGLAMGTADYLPPEQARDAHRADIRADIYSLGCTLYHLLAGQTPFPLGSCVEKVVSHLQSDPKPLDEFRSDLPPELIQVINRMTAKDPAQRYQTPGEVAQALSQFEAPSATSPTKKLPGTLPVGRVWTRAIGVAGLLLVIGTVYWFLVSHT